MTPPARPDSVPVGALYKGVSLTMHETDARDILAAIQEQTDDQ